MRVDGGLTSARCSRAQPSWRPDPSGCRPGSRRPRNPRGAFGELVAPRFAEVRQDAWVARGRGAHPARRLCGCLCDRPVVVKEATAGCTVRAIVLLDDETPRGGVLSTRSTSPTRERAHVPEPAGSRLAPPSALPSATPRSPPASSCRSVAVRSCRLVPRTIRERLRNAALTTLAASSAGWAGDRYGCG